MASFTHKNILKAFKATGVVLANANIVLQRFKTTTPEQDEGPEIGEPRDGDNWRQLRNLFDVAVKDKDELEAKRLSTALHLLQVQNELLHHKNEGLRSALTTKKKHKKKSRPLDLQPQEEYHDGAVFWLPCKIREACVCDQVKLPRLAAK
jgi:hypothetical protein